jgi:succinyl-CoA synthetase beta subunit
MMATLDLLTSAGASVRCMVDLGGTPLADPDGIVPILAAVARLRPEVLFLNASFQTARADDFARAIAAASRAVTLPGRVVVRLKGRNLEAAKNVLTPLGLEVVEGLDAGVRAAVRGWIAREVS